MLSHKITGLIATVEQGTVVWIGNRATVLPIVEEKMFEVLREIGVELTHYHGGSLNGKDVKKVTDNATYVFDQWGRFYVQLVRPLHEMDTGGPLRFPLGNQLAAKVAQNCQTLLPREAPVKLLHP